MKNLYKAFAKLQASMPIIVKAKSGHHGKYADLSAVWAVVHPKLKEHGLILAQGFRDGYCVTTLIHAESGESMESYVPYVNHPNLKPQELGACQTYARRYGLMAALGLVAAGDDDDAQLAHNRLLKMEEGYYDDAVSSIVKRKECSDADASAALDEALADVDRESLTIDGWRDAAKRAMSLVKPDPMLEGSNK